MNTPFQEPTDEELAAYAAILLRLPDPFAAAFQLFPKETGRALWLAQTYGILNQFGERVSAKLQEKIEVLKRQKYAENGKDEVDEFLENELRYLAQHSEKEADRIKALELYAKIKNKIKPEDKQTVNVSFPKVIESQSFSDMDSWEAGLQKQQSDLLNVSRSKH